MFISTSSSRRSGPGFKHFVCDYWSYSEDSGLMFYSVYPQILLCYLPNGTLQSSFSITSVFLNNYSTWCVFVCVLSSWIYPIQGAFNAALWYNSNIFDCFQLPAVLLFLFHFKKAPIWSSCGTNAALRHDGSTSSTTQMDLRNHHCFLIWTFLYLPCCCCCRLTERVIAGGRLSHRVLETDAPSTWDAFVKPICSFYSSFSC